jgi:hypothetical protein
MRKMKTLFVREFNDHHVVNTLPIVEEGCEWVLNGEGYATEKLDGTCCLIEDGVLYKRFDYKKGRELPEGAIPCQEAADPITGHFPHWVKVDESNPADKWHVEAFKYTQYCLGKLPDYTYELVGPHFQGNPYDLDKDMLIRHGFIKLRDVPRTYEGIKTYLETHKIEGIVFYRGNGEMCKIKRRDFGFEWNKKV